MYELNLKDIDFVMLRMLNEHVHKYHPLKEQISP